MAVYCIYKKFPRKQSKTRLQIFNHPIHCKSNTTSGKKDTNTHLPTL